MIELSYPEDLHYTADHEWVQLRPDGAARVGITAYAQDALGDVVYVSLPQVGQQASPGDTCGEVESTKSVSDIYAPLDGRVSRVNDTLDTAPELINTDPYGQGWIFELTLRDGGDTDQLLDAAAYQQLLA